MKSRTVMDMIRSVCKLVMVLITSVAVANILIIVVYGIPTDRMFSHAKSGAELFGSNYIPGDNESFFTCWMAMLFMTVVFLVISIIILRSVDKDER